MSHTTIDDAIGAKLPPQEDEVAAIREPDEQETGSRGIDLSFLKAPTGEGAIEDYMDHPLNFSRSRGLAQMIRGVTGFFGSLDFAIVDVIFGFLTFSKERKAVPVSADPLRG